MHVSIIDMTREPLDVIAMAAGTSTGKYDTKCSRVRTCINKGHDGVLEHASVTFRIEGISRACANQLVRHRMASYVQESQRYCKVDTSGSWYVVPPRFRNERDISFFTSCMNAAAANYEMALAGGMPSEDARYLLPEATKTNVTCTMNAREFAHFCKLRDSDAAQWEIHDLVNCIRKLLYEISFQWGVLLTAISEREAMKWVES